MSTRPQPPSGWLRPFCVLGAILALALAALLVAGCGEPDGVPGDDPSVLGSGDDNGAQIGDSVFLDPESAKDGAPEGAPNFVYIVTDDQTYDQMRFLRQARKRIGRRGVSFDSAYASYPLCCPSRATFLTGQYAHNHGAQGNSPFEDGGGYVNLESRGRVLPAWLQNAGYQTVHVGKWANAPGPDLPPDGWSLWAHTADKTTNFYDYTVRTAPDRLTPFGSGDADHHTDVVSALAADYIRERRDPDSPFFLSVAYLAPHDGAGRDDEAGRACGGAEDGKASKGFAQPTPDDAGSLSDLELPQPPSFNEAEIADKPDFIAAEPQLDEEKITRLEASYRCQAESLLGVDRGVAEIMDALDEEGLRGDTYVIFTSDHGRFNGEHRQGGGKNLPYEEATHVPLLIRGPGVVEGRRTEVPASNVDLAPTILDLAGVDPPRPLDRPRDGLSLVPELERGEGPVLPGTGGEIERLLLIEGREKTEEGPDGGLRVRSYVGIRSSRFTYVEHRSEPVRNARAGSEVPIGAGETFAVELYDHELDPFQLDNRAADPVYASTRAALARAAQRLLGCSGSACVIAAEIPSP